MINMQGDTTLRKKVGDGVMLPLDFFHHQIGRFLTKERHMIPV